MSSSTGLLRSKHMLSGLIVRGWCSAAKTQMEKTASSHPSWRHRNDGFTSLAWIQRPMVERQRQEPRQRGRRAVIQARVEHRLSLPPRQEPLLDSGWPQAVWRRAGAKRAEPVHCQALAMAWHRWLAVERDSRVMPSPSCRAAAAGPGWRRAGRAGSHSAHRGWPGRCSPECGRAAWAADRLAARPQPSCCSWLPLRTHSRSWQQPRRIHRLSPRSRSLP